MIINATPHSINIVARDGVTQDPKTKTFTATGTEVKVLASLESSGILPRVAMENKPAPSIEGFPIEEVVYGAIEGLPPEANGTYYIVSGLVAAAAVKQGRKDCLAPGGLVRDKDNPSAVLGALFLQKP
jgi:hypothetical protein